MKFTALVLLIGLQRESSRSKDVTYPLLRESLYRCKWALMLIRRGRFRFALSEWRLVSSIAIHCCFIEKESRVIEKIS